MREFGRPLEILHQLPRPNFQKHVDPKVETAMLSLGDGGHLHLSAQTGAQRYLASGAKFPSRAVESTSLLISFEPKKTASDDA